MNPLHKIDRNSFIYLLYFLLVSLLFISSVAIIPTEVAYFFQFISVVLLFIVFLFFIQGVEVKSKYILLWLIFVIPVFVSQLFNINNDVNFTRFFLISFVYPIMFFVFLCICNTFDILGVFKPICFSVGLISIISIIKIFGIYDFQFYSSSTDALDYYVDAQSRDRLIGVTGVYINQNTFAPILMAGVFSYLISILYFGKRTYKYFLIFLLLGTGVLLLLTVARAPIFSVFIGLFIFFVFSEISFRLKFFIFFVSLLVIMSFFYLSDYSQLLLDKINGAGLSYRDVIWNDVFNKVEENLLFGIGLGNYNFLDGYHVYSTHNVYLLFLVSLGFLGSLSIFGAIFFMLIKVISVLIYENDRKAKLLCASMVIACLTHQFFEVILDNPLKPFSIFFLLALSYLYVKNAKES